MASGLLSKGTAWIPMQWVRPLSGVALVVPFYHVVSDEYVPHVSNLYRFRSIAEFKADLEYFTRNFELVGLSDIVDALNGRRILPRSCVHLTFDDGFSEMYDIVAPILQSAGVPATFFLTTAFLDGGGMAHHNELSVLLDRLQSQPGLSHAVMAQIESFLPASPRGVTTLRDRMLSIRYVEKSRVRSIAEVLDVDLDGYVRETQPHLTSGQVAALVRQGFAIGAHSHDHPLYADLSPSEQMAQTRMSTELLERFGFRPKAFAFPHNDDGVQQEFFNTVFGERLLDISFGTSGFVAHENPRNIQRATMEKTATPASQILARQFARAAYRRLRSHRPPKVVAAPSPATGSR
jgi:peptidoglycan/xylan/chitin deacetylase (PgdA/CDA1 family)